MQSVFEWLIKATWQSAILSALLVSILAPIRRWVPAKWQYALWLLVLIRLALPVQPHGPWSLFSLTGDWLAPRSQQSHPDGTLASLQTDPFQPAQVAATAAPRASAGHQPIPWIPLALATWSLGALLAIARLLIGRVIFNRRLRACATRVPANSEAYALLEECARQAGIARPPQLLETECVTSPALFGVLYPQLLLPRNFETFIGPAQLRFVLLHELIHLRRRDVALDWFASMIRAIHWFNPAAHFAAARLRAERELACDEGVLALCAPEARRGYGDTLLQLIQTTQPATFPCHAIAMSVGRQRLKQRINMIAQPPRAGRARNVLPAVLVCVLASCTLTDRRAASSAKPAANPVIVLSATQPASASAASEDQRTKIVVDTRFVTLDPDGLSDQKLRALLQGAAPSTQATGPSAPINDADLKNFFRSIQSDRDVSLLTSPRVTVFDGQNAVVTIGSTRSYISGYKPAAKPKSGNAMEPVISSIDIGLTMRLLATSSKDGHTITVAVNPKLTGLVQMANVPYKPPTTAPSSANTNQFIQMPVIDTRESSTTVNIVDGSTVLLAGLTLPQDETAKDQKSKAVYIFVKASIIK